MGFFFRFRHSKRFHVEKNRIYGLSTEDDVNEVQNDDDDLCGFAHSYIKISVGIGEINDQSRFSRISPGKIIENETKHNKKKKKHGLQQRD